MKMATLRQILLNGAACLRRHSAASGKYVVATVAIMAMLRLHILVIYGHYDTTVHSIVTDY